MNTDVKFLKYKERSGRVYVKQELKTGMLISGRNIDNFEEKYTQEFSKLELAQRFKKERNVDKQFELNTVNGVVDVNLEKKNKKNIEIAERSMTRVNSEDVETVKSKKKEVTPPDIPYENIDVGRTVTKIKNEVLPGIDFERRCKDPTYGPDTKMNKDLTRFELEGEIKEERDTLGSDVKREVFNTEFRVKTELSDMEFEQNYKSEFESYRMKEFADMKMEEKVKKELSDMEYEEKCRREAADDVKQEDTSLDEDFDEDFEDQYYDDEFSDQYMELDQLSFNKGEHEQENQIQQILNKYSTVISTNQEQNTGISNTPLGGAALNPPLNHKLEYPPYRHQEDLIKTEKEPNLLKKTEIIPEGGSVNQREKKIEEKSIAERTEVPAGNFLTQDAISFEMSSQRSKPKEITCDICFKKLSSNYTLKNHRMLHTGEKPYSCDHCAEAFLRKPQLVSHMTRAHGVN